MVRRCTSCEQQRDTASADVLARKSDRSLPKDSLRVDTQTYTGTVLASDGGVQRDYLEDYVAADVTYVDVQFPVGTSALGIDASLDFDSTHIADIPGVGTLGFPDLDFLLYDPDGTEIGRSGNGGGPEHIAAAVTRPGTYTYRRLRLVEPADGLHDHQQTARARRRQPCSPSPEISPTLTGK